MTRILKRLAAAACMTLTLSAALAGQPLKIESITYEPQANVNGEQLLLNGAGLRTKIFFKVYTAGLYLKAPARRNTEAMAQNSAARVRLGLLRDVSCRGDQTPSPHSATLCGFFFCHRHFRGIVAYRAYRGVPWNALTSPMGLGYLLGYVMRSPLSAVKIPQ